MPTKKTQTGKRAGTGKKAESKDLAPRNAPQQARARATVDHILATATDLLIEVGVDHFTTNLLAERADVRIRTVYRYFPNKEAVLFALAQRLVERWDSWFDDSALADPACDWRKAWSAYIRTFVRGIVETPGALAIRTALHAIPELRELEVKDTQRLAERVARALLARDPSLDKKRVGSASRLLLETGIAGVAVAFDAKPAEARRLIDALEEMHIAYLELLLEPEEA